MQISSLGKQEVNNYDFSDKKYMMCDQLLYEMVNKYYQNKDEDCVVAKLMIIGRTYAAAIERVQQADIKVNYYEVAKKIVSENIDKDITKLKNIKNVDENTILKVALLHYKLNEIFKEYAKIDKRSLASKYLHFHLPNIVFILDSRVKSAIGYFVDGNCYLKKYPNIQIALNNNKIDKEYINYCLKAYEIYKEISNISNFKNGKESLPRYVDRMLLRYCDK